MVGSDVDDRVDLLTRRVDVVEACTEAGARAEARSWVDRVFELAEDVDLKEYPDAAATWDERLATN